MERIVAIIEKNTTSDVRVRLIEFRGRQYIDVRLYVVVDAVDRSPTKKGISIRPNMLANIIEALKDAKAKLMADGILENEAA